MKPNRNNEMICMMGMKGGGEGREGGEGGKGGKGYLLNAEYFAIAFKISLN